MKKFISFVLVAMLVVTCMATVAFAAGSASAYVSSSQVVNPGDTVTLTVGVTGEFSNYEMTVGADAGLTITSITGVTANVANGKVAFSSGANVTSHAFTITVKVADDAQPGSYNVYATPYYGSMIVDPATDTEDGVVDGLVRVDLASGGCVLTIEEPTCEHSWDNGTVTKEATCTEDGVRTYTCILCGETREDVIPALGHNFVCGAWEIEDGDYHSHEHICSRCGVSEGEIHRELHTLQQVEYVPPTADEWGYLLERCYLCGYERRTNYEPTPEPPMPPTGDITTQVNVGTAAILVTMMSAVALVVKRKITL